MQQVNSVQVNVYALNDSFNQEVNNLRGNVAKVSWACDIIALLYIWLVEVGMYNLAISCQVYIHISI